ncbi:uncharacterized protein LOC110428404 [Herrania umbratica]|uniref:Uncharacterized protein LOC110428404 n=1 Tax=Herrania umbratica TaxID=108875 RepID=A0A6J1BK28_9ROSI|nr:uncharacterized protein LOC110428404 [Herrania umbratica]
MENATIQSIPTFSSPPSFRIFRCSYPRVLAYLLRADILNRVRRGIMDGAEAAEGHHEGLVITSEAENDEEGEEVHVRDEEVNSAVLESWSSTGDEANSRPLRKANGIGEILTSGIVKVAARVRCFVAFGWGAWSVGAVGGVVAAVLMSLVYAKVRRWRTRVKGEKKDQLEFLIQEKEQKINQLLVQIAHMNELLSARRRVAVIRVS